MLFYFNADNNLDSYSVKDINEIESAFQNSNDKNILVYWDRVAGSNPQKPVLLKISNDEQDTVNSEIVKIFSEKDSSNKETLREVIDFVLNNYPAENYGLVFWSHGTGWLPKNYHTDERTYKSYGLDNQADKNEMNIDELQQAIQKIHWDFICFDACYMADVEVAYQLKDTTDYLLFSQGEILFDGLPYHQIFSYFLEQKNLEQNLKKVVDEFVSFYQQKKGVQKTATYSLVKTKELKNLAENFASLLKKKSSFFETKSVQKLSTVINYYNIKGDFLDFVYKNFNENDYQNFKKIFNRVVVYQKHTDRILDILPCKSVNGINIYLPSQNSSLNQYYQKLLWNKDTQFLKK